MNTFLKGTGALASTIAATLVLTATVLSAAPAEAAVKSTQYQKQVDIDCGNSAVCFALLPPLAANSSLYIDHVACEVSGTAMDMAFISAGDGIFRYPLAPQWQRSYGGRWIFTLASDVNIRVPPGKHAEIYFGLIGTTRHGYCAITGMLHTAI